VTQTIAAGFHSGAGYVPGDTNLVACKIKLGVPLFGVVGKSNPPPTGQTTCWNGSGGSIPCGGTGQDGAFQLGCGVTVAPSAGSGGGGFNRTTLSGFTDNGDGTVTDKLTGLIWLKNANCTDTVGGISRTNGYLTWVDALTWSNSLASGSCGLTDGSAAGLWRLPNLNELRSLIDPSRTRPALPAGHPFTGVPDGGYWSASTYAGDTSYAWAVVTLDGNVQYTVKTFGSYFVWPVRGGQ
jgi:hypothetical protein